MEEIKRAMVDLPVKFFDARFGLGNQRLIIRPVFLGGIGKVG